MNGSINDGPPISVSSSTSSWFKKSPDKSQPPTTPTLIAMGAVQTPKVSGITPTAVLGWHGTQKEAEKPTTSFLSRLWQKKESPKAPPTAPKVAALVTPPPSKSQTADPVSKDVTPTAKALPPTVDAEDSCNPPDDLDTWLDSLPVPSTSLTKPSTTPKIESPAPQPTPSTITEQTKESPVSFTTSATTPAVSSSSTSGAPPPDKSMSSLGKEEIRKMLFDKAEKITGRQYANNVLMSDILTMLQKIRQENNYTSRAAAELLIDSTEGDVMIAFKGGESPSFSLGSIAGWIKFPCDSIDQAIAVIKSLIDEPLP